MPLSDNLRGVLLMCGAMLAFVVNDTFVKAVTQTMPLFQAILLRGALASLALVAISVATTGGLQVWPRGQDRKFLFLRTLGELGATLFFLLALVHMPLANLSAIMQSLPLAVTMTAALIFGDKIGWRRMLAILAGFVGVMIIIRPGAMAFDRWSILGLVSVAFVVLRDLATRKFSRSISSVAVSIWASLAVMLMGLIGVGVQGWQPVSLEQGGLIVGSAVFLIVGYICAVKTMRVGDIGIVAPFRYTSLLWAILLGWLLFGSLPDQWTLVGSAVVVASGVYMLLRERKLRMMLRDAGEAG